MTSASPRTAKQKTLLALACVAAFLLATSVTIFLGQRLRPAETVVAEGYDFKEGVDENDPAEGPKVGERVDLSFFKARDGATLKDFVAGRPAVVALVDSKCDAVKGATDQMLSVRERLERVGVRYGLVAFTSAKDSEKFYHYADSLDLDAPAFQWVRTGGQDTTRFMMMVRPSHLLISPDGTVLNKWPGSHPREQTRRRMANQIVSDTLNTLGISGR